MQRAELEERSRLNAELLEAIPSEIFTVEVSKKLSSPHMRKMRQICKFFSENTTVSGVINQLSGRWEVFVHGGTYYFLSGKGHVYKLNGSASFEPRPIYLVNKKPIINVIGGHGYTTIFYMDIDGDYHVSGNNIFGNSGLVSDHPITVDSPLPFVLPNGNKIKKVAAGKNTHFVCDIDGNWYGFGDASEGQLGLSEAEIGDVRDGACMWTPTLITLPNSKKIVDVVTASSTTYLKDSEGQWFGCGYSRGGMLGFKSDSPGVSRPIPLSLPDDNKITKIVAGMRHAFFMDQHGNWYGCGENDSGELGLNRGEDALITIMERVFVPELVNLGDGKKIIDIIAGYGTTFFKLSDDNWYACGRNYDGQLGINGHRHNIKTPLPVSLSNNKKIVKVVTGGSGIAFLDADGHWHCESKNVLRALNMKTDLANPNMLNFDRFENYVEELKSQRDNALKK